ncbi:MAG: hypothetical protein ACI4DX_16010 [Oliverpabstia sp.]
MEFVQCYCSVKISTDAVFSVSRLCGIGIFSDETLENMAILFTYGTYCSGVSCRRRMDSEESLAEKKIPLLCWIIMAAVVLLSAAFGQINMVACIWHLGLVDVASTFGVGFLLLRVYACVMEHEWKGRIASILEEVGFHSIWAVCLHAYEKYIFPWHRVYAMLPKRPMIAVALSFCGRCMVMYFLYRILSYVEKKWKRKKRCVI